MRKTLMLFAALVLFGAAYAAVSIWADPVSLPVGQYSTALASTEPGATVCFSGYGFNLTNNISYVNGDCGDADGSGFIAKQFTAQVDGVYLVYAYAYNKVTYVNYGTSPQIPIEFYAPEMPTCTDSWYCYDSTHKAHLNTDCSTTEFAYCQFGCRVGNCLSAPATPSPTGTKAKYQTAAAISLTNIDPLAGGVILAAGVALITYGFLRREY